MEEIKVSEMLQADSINKDDSVMIIQEGVNKKASGSIQTATGTSLSLTSVADTCKVTSNSKNLFNGNLSGTGNSVKYNLSGSDLSFYGTTATGYNIIDNTKIMTLPAGTYTFSMTKVSGSFNVTGSTGNITLASATSGGTLLSSTLEEISSGSSASVTLSQSTDVYLRSYANTGITYSNLVVGIQIEEGSTATSYNPYNTEVKLNNSIYSGSFAVGDWMVTTGEPRVTSGRVRCADKLQVEPNTEYIFDTELGDITRFVLFYDENQAYLNTYIDIKANNGHFTTSATTKYITFYVISTEATIYDNYVIVEATKKASMQSIALIPQEEKVAFTYDSLTNILSNGSVTITYNTQARLLNNSDLEPVKEYVDREITEAKKPYSQIDLLKRANNTDTTITIPQGVDYYDWYILFGGYNFKNTMSIIPTKLLKELSPNYKHTLFVKTYGSYGSVSLQYVDDNTLKLNGAVTDFISGSTGTDTVTALYGVK